MPDTKHKCLQIYFMGNTDEQIEQRCRYNTRYCHCITNFIRSKLVRFLRFLILFRLYGNFYDKRFFNHLFFIKSSHNL
ncbi:hypothetical protein FWK35_00024162 [Aphis craccivora]|uniref:Uncharacterized protein n=1 Tax=Aphis craccivora TaxID=307492 RepID=A0A6G0Z1Q2_APHCR|nr:hypothetical protein FWK35_00024162 [Aphis craccivora]